MKNYPNIEKSAFKRGAYVGYGGGLVWHITKSNSSYGSWAASPINWITNTDLNKSVFAFGLDRMSEKLSSLI